METLAIGTHPNATREWFGIAEPPGSPSAGRHEPNPKCLDPCAGPRVNTAEKLGCLIFCRGFYEILLSATI